MMDWPAFVEREQRARALMDLDDAGIVFRHLEPVWPPYTEGIHMAGGARPWAESERERRWLDRHARIDGWVTPFAWAFVVAVCVWLVWMAGSVALRPL
ncbi:hypothetical protein BH23CHL8_BH23CHL8_19010 [soil metagenome]